MSPLIVAVYALLGSLMMRPLAGHIAWKAVEHKMREARFEKNFPTASRRPGSLAGRASKPSGDDWGWGWFAAAILCIVWPATLMIVVGSFLPKVGAERRATQAQKLRDQERRIRELERELDLP
jgi:hypothetical protein